MWTMIFIVVMSILTLSLGTLSNLRVPLRVCQYRNHLLELITQGDTEEFDYYGSAIVLMKNVSCNSGMNKVREMAQGLTRIIDRDHHINNKPTNVYNATPENKDDEIQSIEELLDAFLYDHYDYYDEEIEKPRLLQALTEISKLPDITKPYKILIYLDIAPVIVFTIEMFLLLATCPNYRRFFTSWMNVLDIIILASVYLGLLLELRFAKFRFSEKGVKILLYLQMFRVLRVLRYIQHVPAVQVLVFTVRTKYKDLGVIIIFILIGVLLFGNFVYFVDDHLEFTDIPTSWWWGLITMTTVGYGDIVPMTSLGKIVGSLCALSGVICLSLTIPIFVNTFISLYDFSNIYEKNLKRKSEEKINLSVQKYVESSHHEDECISEYGTKEKVQSFVGIRVKPVNN
ncbi:potassium voltage-gated channel subfamily B member 2-like [Argopecten irradians]|uniref:potassium voltage-gated channel subfamily B member 2-like n=1 Tax=Argopecten irradians TaxID=31199 RepID=UPI0037101D01